MLQVRIDCGLLQMQIQGRPDGTRPHGCRTYLEYLEGRPHPSIAADGPDEKQREQSRRIWLDLDREMTQFYHRRIGLLAVAREAQRKKNVDLSKRYYRGVFRDANYTLRAMDFIADNCDDEETVDMHERFRPFILWHRTIASTQQRVLDKDFDEAIEQIKHGRSEIAGVYKEHGLGKWLRHDPAITELKALEKKIRRRHGIKATLKEQLQQALSVENYEKAADVRDQLRAKGRFTPPDQPVGPDGLKF